MVLGRRRMVLARRRMILAGRRIDFKYIGGQRMIFGYTVDKDLQTNLDIQTY